MRVGGITTERKHNMKKVLAVAGLGAAIAATSLLGAGTASADTSSFLYSVHSTGWYSPQNGDASLVKNGMLVCKWLAQGYSEYSVVDSVYHNTGSDVSWSDAREFVYKAEAHLC
jgi:hypothetical protein